MKKLLYIIILLPLLFSCTKKINLPESSTREILKKHNETLYNTIQDEREREYIQNSVSRFPAQYRETVTYLYMNLNIPIDIIYNLCKAESNLGKYLYSKKRIDGSYDYGIVQLNSKYINYFIAKYWNIGKYGKFDIYDQNCILLLGMLYLHDLYLYSGSWDKAIMAYNAGLTRVLKGNIPNSTVQYVRKVLYKCYVFIS